MKNFRMAKGVTEHYTSLEELRAGFGLKPVVKQTKDEDKLLKQRKNFCNHYRCKACGEPMTYIGNGNTMVCTNEKCKGIKHERTDADGNTIVTYSVSYELLDDHFSEVAENIFYETN
jgi:hypothetical protein